MLLQTFQTVERQQDDLAPTEILTILNISGLSHNIPVLKIMYLILILFDSVDPVELIQVIESPVLVISGMNGRLSEYRL